MKKKLKEGVVNFVVLVMIFFFWLGFFKPELLFLDTAMAGGDNPAHNYLASYMKNSLLPNGRLVGWAPGWWGGFPMFQFYFFFPYLLMALVGYLIPLNIAFKLVTALGMFLLPIAAFFSMKFMKFKFPMPIIVSLATIPFLFVKSHTIWGGNIYSLLSGEISMSFGVVFMVFFIGLLYKDIYEGKYRIRTSIILALVVFTHLITTFIVTLGSVFFLFDKTKFKQNFTILFKTFGLAFLLTAFWSIPLISKIGYALGFGEQWPVNLLETFSIEIKIFSIFVLFGFYKAIKTRDKRFAYLFFLFLVPLFLFYFARFTGEVNIRFWPFIYLFLILLICYGFSIAIKKLKAHHLIPLVLAILLLFSINPTRDYADDWIKVNYGGFEKNSRWPIYSEIMEFLNNTPGRFANDLTAENGALGTTRVFEAVPYFINKSIIEGGLVQSGINSMFTYYIQCETSRDCAGFPRITIPTTHNMSAGTKHLKLYNVKHFVARHNPVKEELSEDYINWKLLKEIGDYQIYELISNDGKYVYVPEYEPVLVKTDNSWKLLALDWFYNLDVIDLPLVFVKNFKNADKFARKVGEKDIREYLVGELLTNKSRIYAWLILGSFKDSNDKGLDKEYIDESNIEPSFNMKTSGKKWQMVLARKEYIPLDDTYDLNDHAVAYAHIYVNSPENKDALLHYISDDGIKIFVNGVEVYRRKDATGLDNYIPINITLNKGWNSLLLKIKEIGGGWVFDARITDMGNKSFDDLIYRLNKEEVIPSLRTKIENNCSIAENVLNEEIFFKTNCVGKPHIIKMAYFPNWKVEGASRVYLVTPAFMLVYPEQESVRIYYGKTFSDIIGSLMSLIGLAIVLYAFIKRKNET